MTVQYCLGAGGAFIRAFDYREMWALKSCVAEFSWLVSERSLITISEMLWPLMCLHSFFPLRSNAALMQHSDQQLKSSIGTQSSVTRQAPHVFLLLFLVTGHHISMSCHVVLSQALRMMMVSKDKLKNVVSHSRSGEWACVGGEGWVNIDRERIRGQMRVHRKRWGGCEKKI